MPLAPLHAIERSSFHSNDFRDMLGYETINGKDQAGWEAEFGIVGLVEHLKGLGWERYQWSHTTPEAHAKAREEYETSTGKKIPADRDRGGCFAEFFSPFMHGYLRGDGPTVLAAVNVCLATAQRYAQCDATTKHDYVPYRAGGRHSKGEEYTNGLLMCRHCGFAGYTTLLESLKSENQHLRLMRQVDQEHWATRLRHLEQHGETPEATFTRELAAQKAGS